MRNFWSEETPLALLYYLGRGASRHFTLWVSLYTESRYFILWCVIFPLPFVEGISSQSVKWPKNKGSCLTQTNEDLNLILKNFGILDLVWETVVSMILVIELSFRAYSQTTEMQVYFRSTCASYSLSCIYLPPAGDLCKFQERHSLFPVVPRMQKPHHFINSDFN